MTPIFRTPAELITALRDTVESYDRCGGHIAPGFRAQVLGAYITVIKQAADMLEQLRNPPPVDLRPQYPEIAATVARACAAWPGDYSSIAVALMDGHTNMQMTAADAIASLILLFQNVTKSPFNLSAVLQERAEEARAWRIQQGDPPQWSQG
jgi:hypothetical protein